jgi:hypothetical protein
MGEGTIRYPDRMDFPGRICGGFWVEKWFLNPAAYSVRNALKVDKQ